MADNDISTKKKRLIAALLTTANNEQAARQAGISERTLYRYLNDPAFKAALAQAEEEALSSASRLMATGAASAVVLLQTVILNPNAETKDRLRAANIYLRTLPGIRLLGSIEKRLLELESDQNGIEWDQEPDQQTE